MLSLLDAFLTLQIGLLSYMSNVIALNCNVSN